MSVIDAKSEKLPFLGLIAMGLAVLVIANDFTALSVALPAMESDFASNVTTVQWVINGYALVFGVLIVTGGRAQLKRLLVDGDVRYEDTMF